MSPVGEPPSPRAAHAATAVGTMIVIQGGIGPAGLATDDLHVLDLTQARPKWHRVVVQGAGPGPRYGHVMALVGQRFLLSISGNDGKRPLADVWTLDTAAKPYEWKKLEPDGEGPPPCMYATASSRHDGLLLLCGGRDGSSVVLVLILPPLPGAYGLARHRDGRWEWAIAPGVSPSARYQHAAVFVNLRLHVSGGALGGGRMVEDASSVAVLDTAAGVWCDRKGTVAVARTGRFSADAPGGDASTELTRRCRHAAAAVANSIFIYGGLRGGILLDDLLIADDSPPEPPPLPAPSAKAEGVGNRRPPVAPRKGARGDAAAASAAGREADGGAHARDHLTRCVAGLAGTRVPRRARMACPSTAGGPCQGGALIESTQMSSPCSTPHFPANPPLPRLFFFLPTPHPLLFSSDPPSGEEGADGVSFNGRGGVPGRGGAGGSNEEEEEEDEEGDADDSSSDGLHPSTSSLTSHSDDGRSDTPDFKGGVRLHHRAVVVSADPGGNNLGGLVRQLSIEHFENEGRRISYSPDGVQAHRRLLDRQMSIQGVHKKVLQTLLKPRGWKPPVSRQFFLDVHGVVELCDLAETHFKNEPSVLQVRAPVKIFGDLHGQFGDLMRLFDEYGSPSTAGDIAYIDYLFLGDCMGRDQHSTIEFPRNVHLIRGNHEAADINALFGFRMECIERMGEEGGIWAWHRINQLFNWLPLAALIEHKILCMHGGIGRSIQHVSQIEELKRPITMEAGSMCVIELKRPITMEAGSMVLMDLLWCVGGPCAVWGSVGFCGGPCAVWGSVGDLVWRVNVSALTLGSIQHVSQIEELKRPITMEAGSMVGSHGERQHRGPATQRQRTRPRHLWGEPLGLAPALPPSHHSFHSLLMSPLLFSSPLILFAPPPLVLSSSPCLLVFSFSYSPPLLLPSAPLVQRSPLLALLVLRFPVPCRLCLVLLPPNTWSSSRLHSPLPSRPLSPPFPGTFTSSVPPPPRAYRVMEFCHTNDLELIIPHATRFSNLTNPTPPSSPLLPLPSPLPSPLSPLPSPLSPLPSPLSPLPSPLSPLPSPLSPLPSPLPPLPSPPLQPDRVMEFCHTNDLQLIIRAHECVMDGFERFAGGHLITLFSATNYCGTANNAGAILVLGRDLVVFPKMIHPLPPTGNPANSSDDQDDTWMQVSGLCF
ncbi:unnamed protein product [Closterium sp. NIES-65]|nr:unnamed protein product [Closterium sp. NIES-65]